MPRDAAGNYTLPIAPFVPLTLAKSGEMNTALSDIAAALTDSQSRASPPPAQGDLNLNGHNILNLGEVVGTLTASTDLHVGGNSYLTGTLGVSSDLGVSGNATVSGQVTTTVLASTAGTSVGTDLHVGGNSYLTGTLSVSSDLGVSGNATVSGQVTTTVLASTAGTSVGTDLHVGGNSYLTGTLSAGATTIAGAVTASGYVRGRAVMAYVPATNGGFVGSLSNGSNVGFWNEDGILTWSSADGAGVPVANTTRMTLNSSNNLIVYGDVYALGAMHANGSGVYYPGLPNGTAHGVGFVWTTGGQLDVYIDKTRYGAVAVNFTDRDDEIAELRAMVAALEARVAALE
jgi:predicted acyltransferase (DUF342 family)